MSYGLSPEPVTKLNYYGQIKIGKHDTGGSKRYKTQGGATRWIIRHGGNGTVVVLRRAVEPEVPVPGWMEIQRIEVRDGIAYLTDKEKP